MNSLLLLFCVLSVKIVVEAGVCAGNTHDVIMMMVILIQRYNVKLTGPRSGDDDDALICSFPDHYCHPVAEDTLAKVLDQEVKDALHCKMLCEQ